MTMQETWQKLGRLLEDLVATIIIVILSLVVRDGPPLIRRKKKGRR